MQDFSEELCGRCLATLNVATHIEARDMRKGHENDIPVYPPCGPTAMLALGRWAADKLAEGTWRISMDALPDAFAPISTWHGDKICINHLRDCRAMEFGGHR